MKTLIQEKNNHKETFITVKVSRKRQKVVKMLATETSRLTFCGTDVNHIFGNNVGNEFGVLMTRKGPQETQFSYDNVRIPSLMIYSDLKEYNNIADTKAQLLRCFTFTSKITTGDTVTAGQYVNYQTFSNQTIPNRAKNIFSNVSL